MDDLISEFISETSASLEALDGELGVLEGGTVEAAVLAKIGKFAHTIKSTAGFLALKRLETLAGGIERMLGHVKAGTVRQPAEAVKLVFDTLERIRWLMQSLAVENAEPTGDDAALLARFACITQGELAPSKRAPSANDKVSEASQEMHDLSAVGKASGPIVTALEATIEPLPMPPTELALPRTGNALALRTAEMDAQLLQMAGTLIETRNQLLAFMRRTQARELDAPVKQLSQMIGALQRQVGQELIDGPSIARVVVLEAAGQLFAVAQQEVLELVRIGEGSPYTVEMVSNAWLLRLRDRLLPVMALSELLHTASRPANSPQGYVAVMRVGGMDFGIVVDTLGDAEELVVHPLSRVIGLLPIYRGASLLGDGKIVLQLNVHAIGEVFGARGGAYRPSDERELELVDYLLFYARRAGAMAVPLNQVERLETFDIRRITPTGEEYHVRYHEALLPLVLLPDMILPPRGYAQVMVLAYDGKRFGVVVEHIADIVSAPAMKRIRAREPFILGNLMMAGTPAAVIDLDYISARVRESV